MTEHRRLTGTPARILAVSVVLLEFAAAISTFVTQTLLPVIVTSLHATSGVGVLVSSSSLGLFLVMPLASYLLTILGSRAALLMGMLATVVGGVISATADEVWLFATGRFVTGFASGLLAVFGISAAIRHLPDDIRKVVIATSSAMWILPGLVGPALVVGLEHLIGWRWTLLTPIPFILGARAMIIRAVPHQKPAASRRPVARTLLVPLGVLGFLIADTSPEGWACLVLAGIGFIALMPPGTATIRRGTASGLLSLTLFAMGYFGAGALVTLLFTRTYGTSLAQAGLALGAASVAWGVASLLLTRLERRRHTVPPTVPLLMTAGCVGGVGLTGAAGGPFLLGAVLWVAGGLGVGLFYPTAYLRATTPAGSLTEEHVATAAIATEEFGALVGSAVGGVLIDGAHEAVAPFASAYVLFAAVLAVGALVVARSSTPLP